MCFSAFTGYTVCGHYELKRDGTPQRWVIFCRPVWEAGGQIDHPVVEGGTETVTGYECTDACCANKLVEESAPWRRMLAKARDAGNAEEIATANQYLVEIEAANEGHQNARHTPQANLIRGETVQGTLSTRITYNYARDEFGARFFPGASSSSGRDSSQSSTESKGKGRAMSEASTAMSKDRSPSPAPGQDRHASDIAEGRRTRSPTHAGRELVGPRRERTPTTTRHALAPRSRLSQDSMSIDDL